ncbi:hypothetical protein VP01_496g8 [Puccinia sorghi]|uniref:DUF4219 domain-containing protein n=1 Tax=Puccinia sorghi TaxID=27349 RepID=A0A0L6ULW2_9BASI|nr:hypothetical protein VP01_496g8 [Puccinia sorghi]
MSSEQSIRYSIPILTNTTFATWKTQVLAYCMEYNLDNYLLRDLAPPPAAEADKLEIFESRRSKAAGILLWLLLTDHYESKAADNQAKVYQAFCNFKFTKDLPTFFDELNAHLANMTSVGLKIGIPEKAHIHEHLLSEQIIQKLPESLSHYKDTLFAKRPLTLSVVKGHLQAKISDSTTINVSDSITVKTESALAATTIYCSNGVHNPATSHPESKCWQLHPEQKKTHKRSGKKQAKAAVVDDVSDTNSSVPSDGCFLGISKKQAFSAHAKLTMFLDSGCSDHMFSKKERKVPQSRRLWLRTPEQWSRFLHQDQGSSCAPHCPTSNQCWPPILQGLRGAERFVVRSQFTQILSRRSSLRFHSSARRSYQ